LARVQSVEISSAQLQLCAEVFNLVILVSSKLGLVSPARAKTPKKRLPGNLRFGKFPAKRE